MTEIQCAQPVALTKSFFAYDPDNGVEWFETMLEAQAYAAEILREYRRSASFDGEWSGDVETVKVGHVTHFVAEHGDEESGYDYRMVPAIQAPEGADAQQTWAPAGRVQVMGHYRGQPFLGCLLSEEAEKVAKVGDPLYLAPPLQDPAEVDENDIAKAWNTVRAEARKLSGGHHSLSELLAAVEQYGDRRAAQANVQPKGTAVAWPTAAVAREHFNADDPQWRTAWAAFERIACKTVDHEDCIAILRAFFNFPVGPAPSPAPASEVQTGVEQALEDAAKSLSLVGAHVPAERAREALAAHRSQAPAVAPEVADLVAAAERARDVLAELYAKCQTKIGPFASQAQLANVKLGAALKALSYVPVQHKEGE